MMYMNIPDKKFWILKFKKKTKLRIAKLEHSIISHEDMEDITRWSKDDITFEW